MAALRLDSLDPLLAVGLDAALVELLRRPLIELRPERGNEGLLEGRPGDAELITHFFPPQVGLQHEDHLVERPGTLVVLGHVEEYVLLLALLRPVDHLFDGLREVQRVLEPPDRLGVLDHARHIARLHAGASGQDQVVVWQLASVAANDPCVRIDLVDVPFLELDSATGSCTPEPEMGHAPSLEDVRERGIDEEGAQRELVGF